MVASPASQVMTLRLDRGEVGHHEPVPVGGDESGADQLAKGVENGVVEQLDHIKVSGPHETSGLGQVGQVVAGQVLDLDEVASETPGVPCPVELEEPPPAPITTCHMLHRLVLFHRRLRELTAQLEDFTHLTSSGVERARDFVFRQRLQGRAMGDKPVLELDRAILILQPRELLSPSQRGGAVLPVALDRAIHEHLVEPDVGVVDVLVEDVGVPLGHWEREAG